MKVRIDVMGSGFFEGTSKDGRTWKKLRIMGMCHDTEGGLEPCTADMGFGGTFDSQPKQGETVVCDINGIDAKQAMLALSFRSLVHVPGRGKA